MLAFGPFQWKIIWYDWQISLPTGNKQLAVHVLLSTNFNTIYSRKTSWCSGSILASVAFWPHFPAYASLLIFQNNCRQLPMDLKFQ